MARHQKACCGQVWQGSVRQVKAGISRIGLFRLGMDWRGNAGKGWDIEDRRVSARKGKAGKGLDIVARSGR